MRRSANELVEDAGLARETTPSLMGDVMQLTKARLSLMVVFTTMIGYFVGLGEGQPSWELLYAVVGTALAAASAAALNQFMEAEVDGLMERTKSRPLPAGRMRPLTALWFGVGFGVAGLGLLFALTPPMAGILAVATIAVYLLLYTPLKRRSPWCTIMGAVSGAIPPVIGWAAARPATDWGGWVLFGILFLWQIPHFLAIAWMCRDEYRQAGFVMLKKDDESGLFTSVQALVFALTLGALTLVPVWLGVASAGYRYGAIALDLLFCGSALVFVLERSRVSARRLFFMSILYLPLLLILLVKFLKKA
jgi:protoheme IX farnesyltransferase